MAQSDLISTGETPGGTMRTSLQQRAPVYALALALVVFAFALRSVLAAPLGNQALYLFLVPPVLLAGVFGGWGPGLVSTIACLAIHLYVTGEAVTLVEPGAPDFLGVASRAATFGVLGVGIAWFGQRLHETRIQSAAREAHLESILATVPDAMVVIDERGGMQ